MAARNAPTTTMISFSFSLFWRGEEETSSWSSWKTFFVAEESGYVFLFHFVVYGSKKEQGKEKEVYREERSTKESLLLFSLLLIIIIMGRLGLSVMKGRVRNGFVLLVVVLMYTNCSFSLQTRHWLWRTYSLIQLEGKSQDKRMDYFFFSKTSVPNFRTIGTEGLSWTSLSSQFDMNEVNTGNKSYTESLFSPFFSRWNKWRRENSIQ